MSNGARGVCCSGLLVGCLIATLITSSRYGYDRACPPHSIEVTSGNCMNLSNGHMERYNTTGELHCDVGYVATNTCTDCIVYGDAHPVLCATYGRGPYTHEAKLTFIIGGSIFILLIVAIAWACGIFDLCHCSCEYRDGVPPHTPTSAVAPGEGNNNSGRYV